METLRCRIKRTSQTDYIDLCELYNDAKVWNYLGGKRTSQQIEDRISEWINPQKNCEYWTVREKASDGFLGCILLTPHYDGEYTQISYMFLSSSWGNGFAYETVSQVLHHVFKEQQYEKLIAEAQAANTSSCNLLKKLGFYEVKRIIRFNAEQVIFAIEKPFVG
ncbi:GNAT family N-acetyltransferase [Paenibacillus turpanensis]|uniref:GNAT family N-acetyltransferase n=1 Tax=Paenibacillus turpanensis TaxID=2689078 RepID=UPI001407E3D0|nr:GNAT family N-acetyltransferase [Paenibacillus turpanensis]